MSIWLCGFQFQVTLASGNLLRNNTLFYCLVTRQIHFYTFKAFLYNHCNMYIVQYSVVCTCAHSGFLLSFEEMQNTFGYCSPLLCTASLHWPHSLGNSGRLLISVDFGVHCSALCTASEATVERTVILHPLVFTVQCSELLGGVRLGKVLEQFREVQCLHSAPSPVTRYPEPVDDVFSCDS